MVPLHTENPGGGGTGVFPAARPVVTVVGVQPRTLQAANSIAIAWRSNNYNDGNISGALLRPGRFSETSVRGARTTRDVYTDQTLPAGDELLVHRRSAQHAA